MTETPNHDYNVPAEGRTDWHEPLNENFEAHDTDIEVRDREGNRGDYEPKAGAKFFATDTGRVFLGTGSDWDPVDGSGPTPTLESVSTSGSASFGGHVSVGVGDRVNASEVLHLGKNVTGNGYAGTYVDTTGSGRGRPYYGYAVDGDSKAWHHYDATTEEWVLHNGQPQVAVSNDGRVDLRGSDPRVEYRNGPQRYAGPVAYGTVEHDGTLINGTPNVTSATYDDDADLFTVEFDDVDYDYEDHVATVQLIWDPDIFETKGDRYARPMALKGDLVVAVQEDDSLVSHPFHFTVHEP